MTSLPPMVMELDGFQFGGLTRPGVNNIFINSPGPDLTGKPDGTMGDTARAGADGTSFGIDTLTGQLITIPLVINGDSASGREALNTLWAIWNDDSHRFTAEQMSTLRMNLTGTTYEVYGRPRNFGPASIQYLGDGVVEVTATFQMADNRWYSGEQKSTVISAVPPEMLQAQILNTNSDFEDGTDGYILTGETLIQGTAHPHSGTYSGQMVPDGVTSDPMITTTNFPSIHGGRYHVGAWIYPLADQDVTVRIRFYDGAFSVIGNQTVTKTCTANEWKKLVLTAYGPTGTVRADASVIQTGTPGSTQSIYVDEFRVQDLPGLSAPITVPIQVAGTGNNGGNAVNAGTMYTWPVYVINGPCSNPEIAFRGTNRSIQIKATIGLGESVTLDTHPWARTILKSDGSSLAGKRFGNRLGEMMLAPGQTSLSFKAQDNSGLSSLAVYYRDAHASP